MSVDEVWLRSIDPAAMTGLEIGPLNKPRFSKAEYRVRYVDHAHRDDLVATYAQTADMADELVNIVDIDYAWDGTQPLSSVVGDDAPFDFIFASHVVEHVPNLVGWLRELATVLAGDGRLYLAIPDKRLTFDVNRAVTGMAEVMDAYLTARTSPNYRQIWDFHSNMLIVDPGAMWAGTVNYDGQLRTDVEPDAWALSLCERSDVAGEYVDSHCWVFTPTSFLRLYQRLVNLDLIDYRIAEFEPSQPGTIEFRVVLERLPAALSEGDRRARQLASIPTFTDVVPPPPELGESTSMTMTLSPKEMAFVVRKRRALERARSLLARLR